ncbi:MAG: nicotinate-nucleotide adenylyltransferase, partial [Archaeoglobaceae archaeon]
VYRLFKEEGFKVFRTMMINRSEYHGTEIRKKMLEGDEWKKYVPKVVAEVIEEIGGIERLREIAGRDF